MAVTVFYTRKISPKPNLTDKFRVVRYLDYKKVEAENEILQLKVETMAEMLMEQKKEFDIMIQNEIEILERQADQDEHQQ